MKRLLSLILVLALSFCLVACGEQSEPTPAPSNTDTTPSSQGGSTTPVVSGDTWDEYGHPVVKDALKVGYMVQSSNSEATQRSLQQAEVECAHRGWELIEVVYEEDNNFRDSFQNLVNQGVDAIIIGSGSSQEAKIDLFVSARKQGIGVYCNDNQVVDGIISNCTQSNGVAGMLLFYKIGEDYGWDMNICVVEGRQQQLMIERVDPVVALIESGAYPNLKLLDKVDYTTLGESSAATATYKLAQTWLQKYGEEMNFIYTGADTFGVNSAEAIAAAGDAHGDKWASCGIDGGNRAFAYLRNDTPFHYSYCQPFELYTHNVFEIMNAIQVEGLNPGDAGCPISRIGETVTATGFVCTKADTPPIGTNIHTIFDYYDASNKDAWYNWTDGPGPYVVQEWVKTS